MRLAWLACLMALSVHLCLLAEPAPCTGAGPSAAFRVADDAFVIQTGARPGSVRRHALAITPDGGSSTSTEPSWDGAALPPAESRKIYTQSNEGALPFDWASLPPPLRALFDADGMGEARVAYLRGDRQRELGQPDGVFRKRDGVLGDINHSVPLIVGAPSASIADEGHDAFREQAMGRAVAVYVGANDGMLHAFAAADGAELFAYVPRALIAALAELGEPAFKGRPYVDGSAGQGDALVAGLWRTVLVAGMGMGARGVFALDITDPAAFAQGMGALWEFTDIDDPDIGHVSAAPQVVKLNLGGRAGQEVYRHFAIVASDSGALFLLALDKPAAQQWQAGVNYYRIAADGGHALSATGLVLAADGSASLAYAGDLQGNLWRFDLAAKTVQRLFTARDGAGRAQPIAHAPKAVFAPGGGYLVLFATGKLSEQADFAPSSFATQSMYAIHDRLDKSDGATVSRSDLALRTVSGGDSHTISGETIDYFAPNAKRGWYADFPNTDNDGERAAGSPVALGGAIIFNTVLPGPDPCAATVVRMYVLDALSGLVAEDPAASTGERTPMPTLLPPLFLEVSAGAGAPDATGAAVGMRTFAVIGAASEKAARGLTVHFPARRLGWREVANWQELHDAATK